MQSMQEAVYVGAVLNHDEDVLPVGAGQPLAGIGSGDAGAGGAACHTTGSRQPGQHGFESASEAPGCGDLLSYRRRHALRVNVDQRERGFAGAIGDVLTGAGDQVRARVPIQLVFWW